MRALDTTGTDKDLKSCDSLDKDAHSTQDTVVFFLTRRMHSIAILFLIMLVFGSIYTTVGTISYSIKDLNGLNSENSGTVFSVFVAVFSVSSVAAGFFTDKYGIKRTVLSGSCIMALALLLQSFANVNIYTFILYYVIIGLGSGPALIGACAIVPLVFSSKASSLYNVANGIFGIGAMLGASLFSYMIVNLIPWARIYLVQAIGTIILVVLAFLYKDPNEHTHQHKDSAGSSSNKVSVIDIFRNLSDKTVLVMFLFITVYGLCETSFFNYCFAYIGNLPLELSASDKAVLAGAIVSGFSLAYTIFRLLGGVISLYLKDTLVLLIFSAVALIFFGVARILSPLSPELLYVFCLSGAGFSIIMPVSQAIITKGRKNVGSVISLTYLASGLGGVVSGTGLGFILMQAVANNEALASSLRFDILQGTLVLLVAISLYIYKRIK